MMYDRILVRYGEISTKGRNRNKFIDRLRKNVKRALSDYPNAAIKAERDRMFILLHGEDSDGIGEKLKGIFGIQSFSPAIKVEKDLEKMKDAALGLFRKIHKPGMTFKITAKRSDKTFELDTNGINFEFGGHILRNVEDLKVDVRKPDINLQIEIRKEAAYISAETIKGAGGLPAASGGKGMLMLSGGIDSPVAGYLTMKRGLEVEGVHFFSPPFTSERAKQKVIDLSEKLAEVNGHFALHIVPFTEIQQAIHKQIPENYTMTTTRRLMLRITDAIREKQGGLAIITGESLGQVASQTLESMYAINEVTTTPIIRPLITMDKLQIMDIAHEIDTHDISIRPYEDCCTVFVPSSPKTKPKLDKVQNFESFFDFEEMIQRAVEGTERMVLKPASERVDDAMDDLF
ncbi:MULTISPECIES: tRNA uracil 4-sulfurtransferase ThiI [unclassified Bacillus (in: firmicutes)]|uniref:tRNA uracil 4-sulfurtransferase ThiI n=1 Tax=unclassified Bacillus (in: firmicutes) TaxID=185979 RepID=UPI001BEA1BE9|nr:MULTISPECIES: tRNA uracil 4-sulfurtransferase ThiI [unclassified Bacillus (in: firmicutes)]MBT2638462.1 tRNA 4-thiouridine(8) synthase ThiI [Bacillus sp. ISL-39]MBT2662172.1 tRNA 4-thiouridine(8) synthase ThiI [Bacillus sp. ISL-45]